MPGDVSKGCDKRSGVSSDTNRIEFCFRVTGVFAGCAASELIWYLLGMLRLRLLQCFRVEKKRA